MLKERDSVKMEMKKRISSLELRKSKEWNEMRNKDVTNEEMTGLERGNE